jgi:FkbM family methyltransferase
VEANGFQHVTLIEKPVAAQPGPVTFFINSDDSGGSALWDPAQYPSNVRSQMTRRPMTLEATTIDAEAERLGLAQVKLIKVDVEGADPIVLRGARRLLANRGVPLVLTELHVFGMEKMGTNPRVFREEMGAAGYDSFMLQFKGTLPRYVPPGTSIETSYLCNILFSSGDVIAGYWPTYVHDVYGS